MLLKCSACGTRVAKTWLLLGLPWSKYTCDQCGSVFAGTIVRLLLTSIAVGVLGYALIRVLKGKTHPAVLVPVVGLTLILLLANLPGQIKRVDAPAGSSDTEQE